MEKRVELSKETTKENFQNSIPPKDNTDNKEIKGAKTNKRLDVIITSVDPATLPTSSKSNFEFSVTQNSDITVVYENPAQGITPSDRKNSSSGSEQRNGSTLESIEGIHEGEHQQTDRSGDCGKEELKDTSLKCIGSGADNWNFDAESDGACASVARNESSLQHQKPSASYHSDSQIESLDPKNKVYGTVSDKMTPPFPCVSPLPPVIVQTAVQGSNLTRPNNKTFLPKEISDGRCDKNMTEFRDATGGGIKPLSSDLHSGQHIIDPKKKKYRQNTESLFSVGKSVSEKPKRKALETKSKHGTGPRSISPKLPEHFDKIHEDEFADLPVTNTQEPSKCPETKNIVSRPRRHQNRPDEAFDPFYEGTFREHRHKEGRSQTRCTRGTKEQPSSTKEPVASSHAENQSRQEPENSGREETTTLPLPPKDDQRRAESSASSLPNSVVASSTASAAKQVLASVPLIDIVISGATAQGLTTPSVESETSPSTLPATTASDENAETLDCLRGAVGGTREGTVGSQTLPERHPSPSRRCNQATSSVHSDPVRLSRRRRQPLQRHRLYGFQLRPHIESSEGALDDHEDSHIVDLGRNTIDMSDRMDRPPYNQVPPGEILAITHLQFYNDDQEEAADDDGGEEADIRRRQEELLLEQESSLTMSDLSLVYGWGNEQAVNANIQPQNNRRRTCLICNEGSADMRTLNCHCRVMCQLCADQVTQCPGCGADIVAIFMCNP